MNEFEELREKFKRKKEEKLLQQKNKIQSTKDKEKQIREYHILADRNFSIVKWNLFSLLSKANKVVFNNKGKTHNWQMKKLPIFKNSPASWDDQSPTTWHKRSLLEARLQSREEGGILLSRTTKNLQTTNEPGLFTKWEDVGRWDKIDIFTYRSINSTSEIYNGEVSLLEKPDDIIQLTEAGIIKALKDLLDHYK